MREKFVEEDRKILDFVLKYAEIIKYANEASTGYNYYTKRLGEDSIIIHDFSGGYFDKSFDFITDDIFINY